MKKLISAFAFAFAFASVFSSCLTVGRIQRNCDKFAQICVTGSETETRYRDTTIHFPPIAARLPESNILIKTELKITDGKVNLPRQVSQHGLITTEVEIIDNQLHIRSFLNDSTILVQPDPVVIHDAIREEKSKQTITLPPEKYIPGFYRFSFWFFIVVVAGAVFWLAWALFFKKVSDKYFKY